MPRKAIEFEWDLEELDENGDIIDRDHSETLKWRKEQIGERHDLCLIVYVFDGDVELQNKEWAYIDKATWTLPNKFDDGEGMRVPKQFHDELAEWRKKNGID